jgi:lipopolysaccharide transport system permease protein
VILPVAVVIPGLVDMLVSFVLLLGMLYAFGLTPGAHMAYVPLFLVLLVATSLAAGLWLASLNARYRDVRRLMNFLTQLWFYASPVIYPPSVVPERWRGLYFLNPMAGVIAGFRWAVTGRGEPPESTTFVAAGAVVVLLILGLWYFRKNEAKIIDFI